MADKPTLHEIAAMPWPASRNAMRKHYVHDWGVPIPDGVDRKKSFKVEVSYTVTEKHEETIEVEAFSEDEAKELAQDKVADEQRGAWDIEFDEPRVMPAETEQ